MTPLHWAVENKHTKIVEMLLECNADPTIISKFCKTPLTIAYETEQFELIKKIELAIQTREDDPEQVQEATDRLVLEMQQQEVSQLLNIFFPKLKKKNYIFFAFFEDENNLCKEE